MALATISLAAAACATAADAQSSAAAWREVDARTAEIADVPGLEQLASDFPDSASVRLRLLNARLNAGDREGGTKEALDLTTRGYAFGEEAEAVITDMLDPDYAAWFAAHTKVNRVTITRSALSSTIPAEAELVESLARDPKSGNLYATTVVSRALFVMRGDAPWQRLDVEGAASLSGIVYDPKGKLLWVASGTFEETPGAAVASALIGLDPATGLVARRLEKGAGGALGDVAVGDDGTVYAADPMTGMIFMARPEEAVLRPLVVAGVFRSPQGMAVVAGGKQLIVSDYRYGLAVVDTGTGRAHRVGSAVPAMLDGIDGLWRYGKGLVAVQNGSSPMRIPRLSMSDDWRTVRAIAVLERANPAWGEPLGGTLSSNELLYIATGQWATFGPGGAVREGKTPLPTEIRLLPLGE